MSSRNLDVQIHRISPLLSQTIKQCRRALHMSSAEFAQRLRKTPAYLAQLERAEIAFTSQVLEDCASTLGLSVAELVEIAVSDRMVLLTEEVEQPLVATSA